MARIFDGAGGTGDQGSDQVLKISAEGQDRIEVPGSEFIADADMSRDGQDLILSAPDGSAVVIEGYFSAEPAPMIAGPHGASLSPELVGSFLTASPHYAAAGSVVDESPVGAVEEMKGEATVTHADGTTEPLTIGSPIYQGDVIETSQTGAVNVVFADETSMAVSENARLAVDEYTFDPATESGTTNFSVLRGVFVFTSGLIGRDDPDDVAIETPVGSIGIRGTIIAGNIDPNGDSEITVVEGAIVVKNAVMETTLSEQFETVKLAGMESTIQDMGVLDAKAVGTAFGSVSDVAPSLFSAINDAAKEQAPAEDASETRDAGAEESGDAEGESQNTDGEAEGDVPQEMQMNDANPFVDNTFQEASATKQTTTTTTQTASSSDAPATTTTVTGLKTQSLSDSIDNTTRTTTTRTTTTANAANTEPPPLAIDPGHSHPTVHRIGDNYMTGNNIGYEVTALGDANNDGFADFMFSNNSSHSGQNHSYVVYGSASGVSDGLLSGHVDGLIFSLNDPDSNGGDMAVLVNPSNPGTINETLVRGIGDFDGDGVVDYLVGQQSADGTNTGSGIAYIMNGASPANHIALDGLNSLSYLGASISTLGDINNDGYADLLVGAPGSGNGEAFIVYGGMTSWGSSIDLNTLSSEGYNHTGTNSGDWYGASVAGIGDFNGDGVVDYAIGAPDSDYSVNTDAGRLYIYSGADNSQILNVTGYNSTLMTVLGLGVPHGLGSEVFGVGDINGDGLSDVLFAGDGVGNEAYVLFGGTNTNKNADSLGTSGFKIVAPTNLEILGAGDAGDFNGDGYNDFAIALGNGTDASIYVVYGNSGGHGLSAGDRELNLTDLNNSSNTFKMVYNGGGSLDFSISSAGDTNGDGFDDLVIGAADADGGYGEVIVIDGRQGGTADYVRNGDADDANPSDGGVAASANGQSLVAEGSKSLADDGHNDISFRGGSGNNTIYLSNGNFRDIDGGLGVDTIHLEGMGHSLDFSSFNAEEITQVEYIKFGDSGQNITLTIENIFNMLRTSDTGVLKITYDGAGSDGLLRIDASTPNAAPMTGEIVDALNELGMGATHNASESAGAFEVFDIGGYQLYIDDTILANATIV